MKSNELYSFIEETGGLNLNHLRWCYHEDLKHHRIRNQSFKTYVSKVLKNSYGVSMYVAKRVASIYIN